MKTASCCLTVLPFPWAINALYCTSLWKSLIRGKSAPGRRRSHAVLPCVRQHIAIFPHCRSFLIIFFFIPSYVWPLKRCRMEGSFCWGLIINWPEVTSHHRGLLHIIQRFETNDSVAGLLRVTDYEAKQFNKNEKNSNVQFNKSVLNLANTCNKYDFVPCNILVSNL